MDILKKEEENNEDAKGIQEIIIKEAQAAFQQSRNEKTNEEDETASDMINWIGHEGRERLWNLFKET